MSTPMEDTLAELSTQQRERIEQLTADAKERDAEIATMAAQVVELRAENDRLVNIAGLTIKATCDCIFPWLPIEDHRAYCRAKKIYDGVEVNEPAPVVEVGDGK